MKLIEEYIENELFEEALAMLTDLNDEDVRYLRLVCLYEMGELRQARQEAVLARTKAEETYYNVVFIYLTILMELGELHEGIDLIEMELSMPYIPRECKSILKKLHKDFLSEIQELGLLSPYTAKEFSDDEIREILVGNVRAEYLLLLIDQISKMNARNYLEEIKTCLTLKSKSPYAKSFLLEVLIDQEIDEEIVVTKNGLTIEVNPYFLKKMRDNESTIRICDYLFYFLEDKNPSLLTMCIEFANNYLYYEYPNDIEKEECEIIAASIHYYVATLQSIECDLEEIACNYGVRSDDMMLKIKEFKKLDVQIV